VIFIKEFLFRFVIKVAKDVKSVAVQTDAWHHRSDAITSLAAFIGISIALLGGPGYESADSWAALLASAVIGYNGINLLKISTADLMDQAQSPQVEENVRIIASRIQGVMAIEKCRVRKSGFHLFVDIHVEVDPQMSVVKGHDIAHQVKDSLISSSLNVADVLVHIEPAGYKD
jgi:cation diffusion facilitator family transporter